MSHQFHFEYTVITDMGLLSTRHAFILRDCNARQMKIMQLYGGDFKERFLTLECILNEPPGEHKVREHFCSVKILYLVLAILHGIFSVN